MTIYVGDNINVNIIYSNEYLKALKKGNWYKKINLHETIYNKILTFSKYIIWYTTHISLFFDYNTI